MRVPRSWQDSVNTTLANAEKKYSNVSMIDWYDESATKTDIFYDDKIHPNVEGGKYYAGLITLEIAKQFNKK